MSNPKTLPTRAAHRPGSGWQKIGDLHKGAPKEENKPGKNLTYFRTTFTPQFEYLKGDFEAAYGDKPEVFRNVFLLGTDADSMFPKAFEDITAQGFNRACDGTTIQRWYDPQKPGVSTLPRPCEYGQCSCRMVGHLKLIMGDFSRRTRVWGYFALDFTSEIEINRIASMLYEAESYLGSSLSSAPFVLGRAMDAPRVAKRDKKGQPTGERMKLPQSLVYLRLDERASLKMVQELMDTPALPAHINPDGEILAESPTGDNASELPINFGPMKDTLYQMAYVYETETEQFDGLIRLKNCGALSEGMTAQTLIALIRAERGKYALAKTKDAEWTNSPDDTSTFFTAVNRYCSESEALAALAEFALYPVLTLADWRSSKSAAYAAVIAYVMGYQLSAPLPEGIAENMRTVVDYIIRETAF